jgi:hypothetical protein
MDDAMQLIDAQAAQVFLRRFPAEVQRRGHARFHEGAVESLTVIKPGISYSAIVQDAAWKNDVELHFDPTEGWNGDCSCPVEFDCVHVFAAMSALLAEHRMALVRQLSTGQAGAGTAAQGTGMKSEFSDADDLSDRLTAATGKALPKEALRFLKKVHEAYLRCCQSRQINYWDFQNLGFPLMNYAWAALKIWPAFPNNEHEFWLYVANFLQEQNTRLPEFMLPITDLSPIADRLARWRRAGEIEKWKQTLSNFQPVPHKPLAEGEVDLRLVIDASDARLQWRRPGHTDFEPLKQSQFRQLEADNDAGCLSLTQEAEVLWQLFTQALVYGIKISLDAADSDVGSVLNRLLRIRALESRIVTRTGQPLLRVPEPLRWEIVHAQNEDDDYRLRLVQADGTPIPRILCILPGQPTFYLASSALFSGPSPVESVLNPEAENRIPAPAVEHASGIKFLQSLGVELPPRVRERVRMLSYQIAITCALRPAYQGTDAEECSVSIVAEAPDGQQQSWNGHAWVEIKAKGSRKKAKNDGAITVYDTARLAEVPALLQPLNLKPAMYNRDLALRVTRKFAEIIVPWLKTVPPHVTVNLQGELASLLDGDVAGRVKLEVTEKEIDWFDLQVVLDVADTTLSAAEIKLLLNAKGAYVRLRGKGWRRLQYDLGEEENERLARLGLSPHELSAEPQRLHALQLADDAAKKFLPEQQVEQIHRRAGEIKARVAPDLPAGITAQLRPYQLDGYHFLAYLAVNRFGGILADDMGLGKTLQTLAWLLWLREQRPELTGQVVKSADSDLPSGSEARPVLVVCPKSVMDNWQAEAARFAPGLRVRVWPASELEQLREQLASADLHVLNYSQLRLLGESLTPVHWLAVILDEGQYIKNPSSQTAQIARALRADHRLVLSGTPIENRLMDLWSLMAFTMPGVLGSRAQFGRLYDAKGDPLARRRLAARVRPFLLRRTKSQVAKDLPDRIEEDLFCEIEGEQKTLYRAELKAAQQLLLRIQTQKELAQQQFHFLTSLLRLRQICCHPRLIHPNSSAASAKTESLLEQLEPLMEEGQRVLVFSQFVQMLDLLRPALDERKWPVFYLSGQTENRGELVQSFQRSTGPAVFLISLKAGGFGLNLTAASYVVLFDPWWNPAVENQAIDRTHRIGQINKVIAYRLLIKNSIEEKIRELQKHKQALAQDVFGEEKFAQSLTLEDFRFLFAD